MKSSRQIIAASVSLALTGTISSAFAGPFGEYFIVNSGYGNTAPFNIIESNANAQSIYTPDIIADNNGDGEINADDFIGETLSLTDNSTGGNVTGFLYNDGVNSPFQLGGTTDAGFLDDFTISLSYTLSGTAEFIDGLNNPLFADGTLDANNDGLIDSAGFICATSPSGACGLDAALPNYTTGTIELVYTDLSGFVLGAAGNTQKILQLTLDRYEVDGPNVVLYADVDYSWYTDGTSSLVENFFEFTTPKNIGGTDYTRWYDVWMNGDILPLPINITTRTDFNIDPNSVPTPVLDTTGNVVALSRETNLNLTTEVLSVPEPASLALAGLGLIAAGFARRRKIT